MKTEIIEAIGVKIHLEGLQRDLKIVSAYYTGTTANQDCVRFRRDIKRLTGQRETLILGDFNAKHSYWGCARSNVTGNVLYEEMCSGDFDIFFPASPTYHPGPPRLPSVLDIMLTTSNVLVESVTTADDLGSDHLPVMVEVATGVECNDDATYYNYSKANWALLQRYVQRNIDLKDYRLDSNSSPENIDRCVTELTHVLQEAIRIAVPKKHRHRQQSQMTSELTTLIRLRRAKKRQYMRNGHILFKREYEFLQKRISHLSNKIHNEEFQRWIASFEPGKDHNKKLFTLSRLLRGRSNVIPPLKEKDQILLTESEKAEALASQFMSNHLTTSDQVAPATIEEAVSNCALHVESQRVLNLDSRTFVSPKELRDIISRQSNNKAPGEDGIKNIVLKNAGRKFITALTYICNACLMLSYFPSHWRHAITIAARKPNRPTLNPASYRPISLLPCMSKILERVVLRRIQLHLEQENILPECQFGFRPQHSTTHQVARVTQSIRNGFERQESTGLVLLDLSCAFDSVWHDALIYKMKQACFPQYLVKIIRSFLDSRSFRVRVGRTLSSQRFIPAGVPQGAVLSAALFNIYTSDIPQHCRTNIAQYADDVAVWYTTKRAASIVKATQDSVNTLATYFESWKLRLNPTKTEATYFTRRRAERAFPRQAIHINGLEIKWSDSAKYLGVFLDRSLTFKRHIDHVVEKYGKCIKMLYSLLNRSSQLHERNKLLIFKMILRPSMTYASPAWGNCALSHVRRLQVAQNRCLKMCLNLPFDYPTTDLHEEAQIEMILHHFVRVKDAFQTRCLTSDNPLIASLYNN